METACLRQTELPNTSKLFSDFLYHYDRVAKFFEVPGGTPASSQNYPLARRKDVVSALRDINGNMPALDLLERDGTRAYVTGQQVGLFSGPAYTVYKALTAIRLAERSVAEGHPAAAIFWLATEDHDFAEINHAWSFNLEHQPARLHIELGDTLDHPVGGLTIRDWPIEELRRSLAGQPYGDQVMALVEAAYTPGETLGRAFYKLLRELLEPYGLIFVDPLHPAIREIAAPILQKAIEAAPRLSERLLARNKELEASGYHAQVHVELKTSLFFLLDQGRRISLRRQDQAFHSKERRYLPEELVGMAAHVSPNALLRPVIQDYLLPTCAYVGGPAEVAYFAQSQVLYQELLGYMPRLISRSGFTLFDARASKLMDRYGLRIQDFFHGHQHLTERLSAALIPATLQENFSLAAQTISETLDALRESVQGFDPTLTAAVASSGKKMLYQLSKSQKKVARETMRRSARAESEAAFLCGSLMPQKHLQERFYSILPFLAQHGPDLISRLHESVQLDCPDHILFAL